MNKSIKFSKQLIKEIKEDRVTGLAAEQAYYYLLALFPLLILLLSILPYLNIDIQTAMDTIKTFMPTETVEVIEENIINILSERNGGLLTFGFLGTIWSASNGMNAFIHSMNIAYDVKETRNFIKARFISIILTLGLVVAFIVMLGLPVFGKVIIDLLQQVISLPEEMQSLFSLLRWIIAVVVISLVLTFLYRFAPNKSFPIKHVIPGAVTATVLWLGISLGFSFYVSNFANYSSTYGSLGGVIILMLWLYLSGLIFVIGGEINAILHRQNSIPKKQSRTIVHPVPLKR
ncbi:MULTISPECIES: YihY/virulence factor BrkB family protein [Peribacillus]|uniref:YihY/virulence factor BrkB family protein n=1 Tax=Peribacillus TaxID=2675229 RepID=UPI00167F4E0F|nr:MULTISPECIES: YihY/virulence factor BrkB family protein [Peribacillus]MBK5444765.1 YihY/virulence factor BrkB family protein [Peribacillus sp. TH24]MBK5460531.1 YihY/virulence factor BrkB family protein [Peribacillus sp. TH27]MBK5482321.1 YihY/virulence factor BrkB family protein [Peribacillus sp. TH16]MBK5498686.1 YihY/virulence factor BrkB family protein [Peribacillus sp. TH14]MCO0596314.1 YihY/virulence factor BrkB family protein [Peribacillus butanolivorans]